MTHGCGTTKNSEMSDPSMISLYTVNLQSFHLLGVEYTSYNTITQDMAKIYAQLSQPLKYTYSSLITHMHIYRTLRGRDQRKKCTLNFIKYTLSRPTASSTTKSALLHRKECFIHSIKHSLRCNKALFVGNKALFAGNKAQLPSCLSVG